MLDRLPEVNLKSCVSTLLVLNYSLFPFIFFSLPLSAPPLLSHHLSNPELCQKLQEHTRESRETRG
jgi:hypothetical protein